jgi:hypothetical protein
MNYDTPAHNRIRKETMIWPLKRTDRIRSRKRASELKFQQKRPMTKSRTWFMEALEDKKKARTKLIKERLWAERQAWRLNSLSQIKCKL